MLLYPLLRFSTEFLRGDERMQFLGLTVAQVLSMGFFCLGTTVWIWFRSERDGVNVPV